jgi:hypothetical protein
LLIAILACGLPPGARVPPTATPVSMPAAEVTPTPASESASPAPTASPLTAIFSIAVIVDTTSEPVSREQAETLIGDASRIFSGLVPFGFQMVDFIEDGSGASVDSLAAGYVQTHSATLPNGLLVLSYGENDQARTYGGYSTQTAGPAGFRNPFVSPVFGSDRIYVAVVHFSHRFGACGYGGADSVQSPVSIDGECRNQAGTACVQHNGYSMCSNLVNDLYASTPTYLAATSVIHEFLHAFSPGGNQDHYATPECNARMGYPAGFFDLLESEYNNGLCPFVYENFVNSYQP